MNQNLKDELRTPKKMEGFSKKLKPEHLGIGEEEEKEEIPVRRRSSGSRRLAA